MFKNEKANLKLITEKNSRQLAKSYIENEKFSTFVDFSSDFLSGSWENKYGLLIFRDHNKDETLDSFSKIKKEIQDREVLSVQNFPYDFKVKFINPIIDKNRYLSNYETVKNRKHGNLIILTSDDADFEKEFDSSIWTEELCSVSRLTPQQLVYVFKEIFSLPEKEKNDILLFNKREIERKTQYLTEYYFNTQHHQEKPFSLKLYGNDNIYYIQTFKQKEDAWACYQEMVKKSKTEDSYELVKRLGFHSDS